jgi:hypothetical protein
MAAVCHSTSSGFTSSVEPNLALNPALGAEQVFQHVLVAFPGRAEQVRAPDEQVARMVLAVVRLLAGEADIARF